MKNLVRNGGFERGTTDFWKASNAKSFGVVDTPVHKGSYAGKLVCAAGQYPTLTINDYIEMKVGEIAYYEMYLRASGTHGVHFWFYHYDENLDQVDSYRVEPFNVTSTGYTQYLWALAGSESGLYVKPLIYFNRNVEDSYLLIDNVLMYKLDAENTMARNAMIYHNTNITSGGTYYGDWIMVAPFSQAEFKLFADTCVGTSETMDVTIESHGLYDEVPHTIATFNQVTTSDDLQVLVVTAGLGEVIRAKVVVGGSPSVIDVRLTAVFKR